MHQQLVTKSHQPILMSEYYSLYLPRDNAIHQPEKLFALKIESFPYFEHPLIHLDGLLFAELLKDGLLVQQVWFLCLTGYTAIGDGHSGLMLPRKPQRRRQLLICVVSSVGNRPFGRQNPQTVPFLDGLD